MKQLVCFFMLVVFGAGPAAFGAAVVTPEQIYKTTYIEIKKGEDPAKVLNGLLATAAANKIDIKTVLESAVAKGWMSQDQLNTVLDIAQKNASLVNDKALAAKAKAGVFSKEDVQKLEDALSGQVSGASYWCGRYGCYHRHVVIAPLGILLIALLFWPVVVYD